MGVLAVANTVVAQPHVWSPDHAYAYPYASPNGSGDVGLSLNYGDGELYPSHAVGVLVDSGGSYSWQLVGSTRGRFGPETNHWGDYLNVRTGGDDPRHWFTVGFTLQTGRKAKDLRLDLVEFWLE